MVNLIEVFKDGFVGCGVLFDILCLCGVLWLEFGEYVYVEDFEVVVCE